jgi:hypothetical protein
VHARPQFDFETQRDSESRTRDAVARRSSDPEVSSLSDCPRLTWLRSELPGQNIGGGDAVLIIFFEVLGSDLAIRVDDVHTRIRDSVAERTRLNGLIQNVESAYDLGVRVREQRIRDVLPVAEALERPGRIIADGSNAKALAADGLQILFQLDELDFAPRSPVRGAEKHQHGAVPADDGF